MVMHAIAQEPLPWGHDIHTFSIPFISHNYYILDVSLIVLIHVIE